MEGQEEEIKERKEGTGEEGARKGGSGWRNKVE